MGFLVASTPLSGALMGWRGAGGGGAALIGVFYFFGGALQVIGSLLEWILGNTFSFVVFGSYGAFWLAFGVTLQPAYNAEGAYTAGKTGAAEAAGMAQFESTYAFYLMSMALLTFMYLICSLRINIIFALIFFFLDTAQLLLTASYWITAKGNTELGEKLQKASGAFIFIYCVLGWYLLFAQLLQSLDFPFSLPVGDLSTKIKSATDRKKDREEV
uniref:GPR1/FUN34/YaaH-class plasma membrane protein n=1 Tax=Bionectria ochroleuca TaxID=29856 RepID=A0A8H7MYC3_BIOOC